MPESNPGDFEGALDFFLLSRLSDGPRSLTEIQQQVNWAERLLLLAAERKGMRNVNSVPTALERLQRDGWLKREENSLAIIYSLTESGEQRLALERARRHSIASQFVEENELDQSFAKFLSREN